MNDPKDCPSELYNAIDCVGATGNGKDEFKPLYNALPYNFSTTSCQVINNRSENYVG